MVMYEIVVKRPRCNDDKSISVKEEREAYSGELMANTDAIFRASKGKTSVFAYSFAYSFTVRKIYFAAISDSERNAMKYIDKYMDMLPFEIENYDIEELVFCDFNQRLSAAERNDFISEKEAFLKTFEIDALDIFGARFGYGENILDDRISMDELKKQAEKTLFSETLLPELDRIASGEKNKYAIGHPVHYMVCTDSKDMRKIIYRNVLTALYQNGRIKNKRYAFCDLDGNDHFNMDIIDALYKLNESGAIVLRYVGGDEVEGEFGRRSEDLIKGVCEIARKYKNTVLTVICVEQSARKIKEKFMKELQNISFVEFSESVTFYEGAKAYLTTKAREHKIRTDSKLFSLLSKGKGYCSKELDAIFDMWHSNKLRTAVYPQYKDTVSVKAIIKDQKHKGNAYEEFNSLIGLSGAKDIVQKALNYYKAQQIFADRGVNYENPSMHMVFTGNPGTAKTTVARLFAQIMKDNGLLSIGNICEVGRADIVGKYVGSTAPLVKEAFKKAKGGVLFIDEAYSLVDDRNGLFGDEAINTIVQEMENNRKDTIVIFAGYPDKMETFLQKNPGLRSRIAFHVPFEDYSSEELCCIADLIARKKGFVIDDTAKEKLQEIFVLARGDADFGNGRFARNIIEKAILAQASRLVNMELENVTDDKLRTICAEDIDFLQTKSENVIRLGFCV